MPMPSPSPKNVLLIFSDQQHRYALGRTSDGAVLTPNLDRLADEGVLFNRCYSNNPVCGPFRGTLLTGQYASRCGVMRNGNPLPDGTPTFAGTLNADGHRTGFVGKWHLGGNGNGPIAPDLRGRFQDFIGYQCYNGFHNNVCFYDEHGTEHRFDRHRTDVTTDLAIERLRAMAGGPFALVVSYQAPHYPEQPSPQYAELYEGRPARRRPNASEVEPYTQTYSPPSPKPRENDPDFQRYGGNLDEYIRLYNAMCTQIDAGVGRLLETLDDLGLTDDTLVIYTSDHGDMQGSHGLVNKCLPYEESAGIPLIVRLPGGRAGETCDGPTSGVDLMPTCLHWAGAAIPDTVDGRGFLDYLQGGRPSFDAPVFSEDTRWCMIVRGPWKLVADRRPEGPDLQPTMLFNLDDDPAAADAKADLFGRLMAWDHDVRDSDR